MQNSTKGKGAWVSGARSVEIILDELYASQEVLSIRRYRKFDDAIIKYHKNPSPHGTIIAVIPTGITLETASLEAFYHARLAQLRAWGWFSLGPEDLTGEE